MRDNAQAYGGDPDTVFVAGGSAGADLAATAGLTGTQVSGVIGFYGYYGNAGGSGSGPTSPKDCINPNAPPFLVIHGALDTLVLRGTPKDFVDRLRAVSGQPVVYTRTPRNPPQLRLLSLPAVPRDHRHGHPLHRAHHDRQQSRTFDELITKRCAHHLWHPNRGSLPMRITAPPAAHHAAAKRDRIVPRSGTRSVDALDVLVFIIELALLAALAAAGAQFGSQATAITLALLLPLVSAVLWGLYLALRASGGGLASAEKSLVAKLAVILAASAWAPPSGASAAWGLASSSSGAHLSPSGNSAQRPVDREPSRLIRPETASLRCEHFARTARSHRRRSGCRRKVNGGTPTQRRSRPLRATRRTTWRAVPGVPA